MLRLRDSEEWKDVTPIPQVLLKTPAQTSSLPSLPSVSDSLWAYCVVCVFQDDGPMPVVPIAYEPSCFALLFFVLLPLALLILLPSWFLVTVQSSLK